MGAYDFPIDAGQFLQAAADVHLDFLLADSCLGTTFAELAIAANDTEKSNRNRANARKVYDTVVRFMIRFPFSESQETELQQRIRTLQRLLRVLGEKFPVD